MVSSSLSLSLSEDVVDDDANDNDDDEDDEDVVPVLNSPCGRFVNTMTDSTDMSSLSITPMLLLLLLSSMLLSSLISLPAMW